MIGKRLERYELLDEVGQGGMSVVYVGRDTALNREVAVKVLHDHLSGDRENRERFRREAEAIARLDHPHILDVFDYSDEDDDHAYIVMEYISGVTLREFVEEHPGPPPETAALIAAQIADALAHAHEHGVIHRDLKPENVMVADGGSIKLMDFGIAHVTDAETVTQTGSLLGSPAHMAPEIIDGQSVNARSDIFSLGTVLYWLTTGEFPFYGENAPHVLQQVLECDYEAPEHVEPRVPSELSDLICRCMSRNPEARFEDVEGLREALVDAVDTLGDVDPQAEIEDYFADPEGYVEQFEDEIVDVLVERGDRAMAEGDVPTAMRIYSRALEYDPSNPEVTEALDDLDRTERNREWAAWGAVGVALLAVAGIGYWALSGPSVSTASHAAGPVDRAVVHSRAVQRRAAAVRQARLRTARSRRAGSEGARMVGRASGLAATVRQRARGIASSRAAAERTDTNRDPTGGTDRGSGGTAQPRGGRAPDDQPSSYEYRFRVLPLAATVTIDGEQMSATRALQGLELEPGVHRLRAESRGCEPLSETFRVDGPADGVQEFRLQWKDGTIEVFSNRPAIAYLGGDTSNPYEIGASGESNRISIPFGRATSSGKNSRKTVELEIRPRDNLQLVHRQTVTLRPGETASVSVDFAAEQ
ncbi:MAG: serine/threonine-protein kinase [Bradymonadaceae bacterium]